MLKVNEIFGPTIQGEGKSVGKAVVFLRLSGCNLHCVWCDTPYTWNWEGTDFAHPQKFKQSDEEHLLTTERVFARIRKHSMGVESLVISGGEPLIQQKKLVPLLEKLKAAGWWIEVETNGTVAPLADMLRLVDQFNCSPKLSNSGDPQTLRIKGIALGFLSQLENCYFKFVVTKQQDMTEILVLIRDFNLPLQRIFLMPEGMSAEALDKTRALTQELASYISVRFSDRLHITELGGGRGV